MSQGWSKLFSRINWMNRPSTATSLGATNLNKSDYALDGIDNRVIQLDTIKADMITVNGMVSDVSLNESNGVITITYKDGSTKTYDTNLEKIATNFTYDYSTQRLVLTLSDGSKQYVDMSALITQYEFEDSTTIAFSVDSTGKISASVKNGSITEAMLETGYLSNIKVEVAKAEAAATQAQSSEASSDYNAKLSRSYAVGGSGIREGEDTDNAMYYCEQAQKTDASQIRKDLDNLTAESTIVKKSVGKFINDTTLYGKAKLVNLPHNMLNPTLETTTQYGVTCTKNGDGTYTLNGTSTKDGSNVFYITNYFSVSKDTRVRFVGLPKNVGISLNLWSHYSRPNVRDFGSGATGVIYTNQTDGSIEEYGARIIIGKDVTLDNVVVKPMLINLDEHPECADITYDDFVQYSGYEVKSCGKNLFNVNNWVNANTNTQGTLPNRIVFENGGFTETNANNISWNSNNYIQFAFDDLKKNTDYVLKYDFEGDKNPFDVSAKSGIKNTDTTIISSSTKRELHFNTGDNDIICVQFYSYYEGTFKYKNIMLCLESTDLDYEPYQSSSVTVTQDTTEAWLDTFDGETNIIAPIPITTMYGTNLQGNEIMTDLYDLSKLPTINNIDSIGVSSGKLSITTNGTNYYFVPDSVTS